MRSIWSPGARRVRRAPPRASRHAGPLVLVDADRIGGIESDDAMALDEHQRRLVVRARRAEELIEADLERARFQFAVPIRVAVATEAVVPFAERRGAVAGGLEQRGERHLAVVKIERAIRR